AWWNLTPGNQWRLESGYVDWVKNLPAGLDREMASFALLKNLQGRDPALAETLKAEIKDPKLVAGLEEKK
ncbi:MAG TPA: hypothetical protein VM511_07790, partial [Luteolibacter sp.]|nr:hypothetical protein [Luteolibacter sp.]